MKERQTVSRNEIVTALLRIGHGDLSIYVNTGIKAAQAEPELLAHVIAYNEKKGEVRDSKTALPVLALRGALDRELYENALAHLCLLDPRSLVKAQRFHIGLSKGELEAPTKSTRGKLFRRIGTVKQNPMPVNPQAKSLFAYAIKEYLHLRESNIKWWDKVAVQHRESLKTLYALNHIKPCIRAQEVLFKRRYPKGSVFEAIKQLHNMKPDEAAGTILNCKIPFLVAVGALGGIKNKPDVVLGLIENMSGGELITNTKTLERLGVFESPALKAAYNAAVKRVEKDKKVSTLKTGQAAKAMRAAGVSEKVVAKLEQIQEHQIDNKQGIEGDWLVLVDRSGSMQVSLEVGCEIAAYLTRTVKGKVHLVTFNTAPDYFDMTGKTLEQIKDTLHRYRATGGTSIGCGLELLMDKGIVVNGIAISSDGGDNSLPLFHQAYARYKSKFGIEPPVYLYHVPGEEDVLSICCQRSSIMLQKFKLGTGVDYYSIPNFAATMRTSRYSLVDEIMSMPLLTFADVFGKDIQRKEVA